MNTNTGSFWSINWSGGDIDVGLKIFMKYARKDGLVFTKRINNYHTTVITSTLFNAHTHFKVSLLS
jgi:hypothetical protein